jgi:hypothetical protein
LQLPQERSPRYFEVARSIGAIRPWSLAQWAPAENLPPAIAHAALQQRAKTLRRHVLRMAERVGQGYVGQGLGIADLLAVVYFHELRYDV